MKQRQCEICEEEYKEDIITRTPEGDKAICMGCYNLTAHELRKSSFTSKECMAVKRFLKLYNRRLFHYMAGVQAEALRSSTSLETALESFLKAESEVAENEFKKDRKCLYKSEHYTVMGVVLDTLGYGDISKNDVPGREEAEEFTHNEVHKLKAEYLATRECY